MQGALKKRTKQFKERIAQFIATVEEMKEIGATMEVTGSIKDVNRIKVKVDKIEEEETALTLEGEEINAEEDRLGQVLNEFVNLTEAKRTFHPSFEKY